MFNCYLDNGNKIASKTVILAIGRERRKLGLDKEDEWTGKGVSYCSTCDAPLYKNKNLAVVVGGGNAAVEGAILIAKYAKRVLLEQTQSSEIAIQAQSSLIQHPTKVECNSQ